MRWSWGSRLGWIGFLWLRGLGFDEGMRERISRHRSDRDSSWRTVEEAVEVWDVIARECRKVGWLCWTV